MSDWAVMSDFMLSDSGRIALQQAGAVTGFIAGVVFLLIGQILFGRLARRQEPEWAHITSEEQTLEILKSAGFDI